MSQSITCDGGCGFTSPNASDFKRCRKGLVREYCTACAVIIDEYLSEVDGEQEKAQKAWEKVKTKLSKKYEKLLPNGEFPYG